MNDKRRQVPAGPRALYLLAGAASVLYYFVIGHASRFGLSMSLLWPALGGAFLAAALLSGLRLPRWLRLAWRGLLCLGLACLVGLECLVVSGMFSAAPAGMDALIVLGARVDPDGPSPALRRRLNAVMAVLPDHPDAVIIASGGQGPDEPMSEAACIREELIARGVDPGRVRVEDRSTTTAENLAFSKALLPSPDARVGIVTNNYHVWRAIRLARNAGYGNVWGIAAKYTGWTLFHYMVREAACIPVEWLRGNL